MTRARHGYEDISYNSSYMTHITFMGMKPSVMAATVSVCHHYQIFVLAEAVIVAENIKEVENANNHPQRFTFT